MSHAQIADARFDWIQSQLKCISWTSTLQYEDFCKCDDSGELYWRDDLTWIENRDVWVHADHVNVVEDWNTGEYMFECDAISALDSSQRDVWVHEDDENHIYTDDGNCYVNDEAAQDNDYRWCEHAEEYTQNPRQARSQFDNPWTYALKPGNEGRLGSRRITQHQMMRKLGYKTLSYRATEGLAYKFGVEIETESHESACNIEGQTYDRHLNMGSTYDGSISGNEYVTGVLTGDAGFKQMERICTFLQDTNHKVDKTCGIHVHVSGPVTNRDFQLRCIMLGLLVQDELFEFLPKSRKSNTYCKKIPAMFWSLRCYKSKDTTAYKKNLRLLAKYVAGGVDKFDKNANSKHRHPNGRYCSSRYKWLNLNNCAWNGINTIEFRLHNSTIQYPKVKNAILMYMAFVKFAEDNGRLINKAYDDVRGFYHGEIPKISNIITFADIINYAYSPKLASQLLSYAKERRDKFAPQIITR
jgi:hypothetical protein